ncbi:hypothetical protein ABKN59_009796 [Abortiporus biennis]
MSQHPLIDSVREALNQKPPFSFGTIAVEPADCILYYGNIGRQDARRLDFLTATPEQLAVLSKGCDVATFGFKDQDVHDESYRKAGKLDLSCFATNFDVDDSGLLEIVEDVLLRGDKSKLRLRAELYKLNVYGQGSFFKSHKDTPRGDSMCGSLVVFFPSTYEGGDLVLRDNEKEWRFNSSNALSSCEQPSFGYAAFYSDVEHEVAEVTHGYRVTLTYNLYYHDDQPSSVINSHPLFYSKFKQAFQTLLDDPTFLPHGGVIGFGLQHEYPFRNSLEHHDNSDNEVNKWNRPHHYKYDIGFLGDCLKGKDAAVMKICKDLILLPSLKVVLKAQERWQTDVVLCDGLPDIVSDNFWDEYVASVLRGKEYGGKLIDYEPEDDSDPGKDEFEERRELDIVWMNYYKSSRTMSDEEVITGDKEAHVLHVFAYICIVIEVGGAGSRAITDVHRNA